MHEIKTGNFVGDIESAFFTRERGFARHLSFYFGSKLSELLVRLNELPVLFRTALRAGRREVAIRYTGLTGDLLMMKSERMSIPDGRYTLGQLLSSLYKRGDRWAYELDDSHLVCTINGKDAGLFDTITPGAKVHISSGRSRFES